MNDEPRKESEPKSIDLNINAFHTGMVGIQLAIGEKAMIRTMLEMTAEIYAKTFNKSLEEVDRMVDDKVENYTLYYANRAQKDAEAIKAANP